MNLAEKLKTIRKKVGLSQLEVAKRMGFNNYQTIAYIESGKRKISAVELYKFSQIYGYPFEYFLGINPVKKSYQIAWREEPPKNEAKKIESEIYFLMERYAKLKNMLNARSIKFTGYSNDKLKMLWNARDI